MQHPLDGFYQHVRHVGDEHLELFSYSVRQGREHIFCVHVEVGGGGGGGGGGWGYDVTSETLEKISSVGFLFRCCVM